MVCCQPRQCIVQQSCRLVDAAAERCLVNRTACVVRKISLEAPASSRFRRAAASRSANSGLLATWGFSRPIFARLSKVIGAADYEQFGLAHHASDKSIASFPLLVELGHRHDNRVYDPPQAFMQRRECPYNLHQRYVAEDTNVDVFRSISANSA